MSIVKTVEVRHVSKTYMMTPNNGETQPFKALDDVSFSVDKGDILAIIGSNGSGKSTLLKILSQITKPTSGEVRFCGSVTSILDIGANFHPDLTGRENVQLKLNLANITQTQATKAHIEILAFSEINSFYDVPVKLYSNGMFLRLAFSLAFQLPTDILILDEVLSVGDEGFRLKTQKSMRQFANNGHTILFVSHSRHEILEYATKCLWLKNGRIEKEGQPSIVVKEYFTMHRENFDSAEFFLNRINKIPSNDGTIAINWEESARPSCSAVELLAIAVKPVGVQGKIYREGEIELRFKMNKKQKNILVAPFFYIQDVFYQPVLIGHFLSNKNGVDLSELYRDKDGIVEVSCILPANFLVAGKYYLYAHIGVDSLKWTATSDEAIQVKEILEFTVHQKGANSDFIDDPSKGSVRPLLDWKLVEK